MPININEIRVIATIAPEKPGPQAASTGPSSAAERAKWIEEAVAEVLRVLEEKKER